MSWNWRLKYDEAQGVNILLIIYGRGVWREESSEVGRWPGCQWPDLIPIRADQQICGFCRWSHDGSRAWGDENEFIRSEGLTLSASQGAINTHPSICLDSCSQSFESHESALESKITRDQQIDKLYNKGWQKIPADNQVSISPQVREGRGRAQRMSRNWTLAPVELIGFYKFHKKGDFYCKLPF